jgi:hypothetical protein
MTASSLSGSTTRYRSVSSPSAYRCIHGKSLSASSPCYACDVEGYEVRKRQEAEVALARLREGLRTIYAHANEGEGNAHERCVRIMEMASELCGSEDLTIPVDREGKR